MVIYQIQTGVHEPTCGLWFAEDPTGELPYLYGVPGRQYGTFREQTTVAALVRATHQLSISNSMKDESRFELFVRQAGRYVEFVGAIRFVFPKAPIS